MNTRIRSWIASAGPAYRPFNTDARGVARALRRRPWHAQAAKYATVGLLNTALDAGLYLLLTHWLGFGGVKVAAKGMSYAVGIVNSYHWNRVWTFRSQARVTATFISFVLVSLTGLAVNSLAMYLSLDLLHQPDLVALGVATGSSLLLNFTANKLLVFRT